MRDKKRFCLMLAGLILTVSIVQSYAATTQEKISDAETQKKSAESTLEDTRTKIADLESKKGQSEAYLSDLSQQLSDLQESLEQLQQDSQAKQTELEQVQLELEESKEQEAKQYGDMKLRIQYMYENSNSGYIEMLFSSENFGDFLSSAQNMVEINKYDRDMLVDYQVIKEQVQDKEEKVIEEQKEIAELQEESAQKQEQVQELYKATYDQIREYNENLDSAQSEANGLLSQISAQEENITQLMIQAKTEEAERQQREAAQKAAEEAAKNAAKQESTSNNSGTSQGSNTSSNNDNSNTSGSSGNSGGNSSNSGNGTSDGQTSNSGTYLGKFKLTSYCNCEICCGKWSGGLTASGTTPTPGRTIAMAGVPFGTQLLINGHVYTVEDRGTQYGHVDVFSGSHSEALSFGLKYADVYRLN